MLSSSSWDLLPIELLFEIFLLLPVLTLVPLRVVSKQWQALIDSPTFRKSHFNKAAAQDSVMVVALNKHGASCMDLYSLWNCSSTSGSFRSMIPKKISYPLIINDFAYSLAPINGVLCAVTVCDSALLWNPFIRKHLLVPPPVRPVRIKEHRKLYMLNYDYYYWSFGYDGHLDDYKLVFVDRLEDEINGELYFPVWVYSVKLGIWKRIGDMPYPRHQYISYQIGAFVSGALHRRVYNEEGETLPDSILALDLRNLEYKLMHFPPKCLEAVETTVTELEFGVLDGCLCVHSFTLESSDFETWVMKEYGVNESWTMLITSTCRTLFDAPIYVENGKKLLYVAFGVLTEYDVETRIQREIRNLRPELCDPHVYTPTLLFPSSD